MKIVNVKNEDVKAAVAFSFHGHELSASTILFPHEVLDITTGETYFSIEQAIEAILKDEKEAA